MTSASCSPACPAARRKRRRRCEPAAPTAGAGERVVARRVQREARGGARDLQQATHRALGHDDVQALAGGLEGLGGAQDRAERARVDEVDAREVEDHGILRAGGRHREDRAHLRGGGKVELAAGDDQVAAVDGVVVEGEHEPQPTSASALACSGRDSACVGRRSGCRVVSGPARRAGPRRPRRRGSAGRAPRAGARAGRSVRRVGRQRPADHVHARRSLADRVVRARCRSTRPRRGPCARATTAPVPSRP